MPTSISCGLSFAPSHFCEEVGSPETMSFATVMGTAFLLLVSLVLSTVLAAVGKWFGTLLPFPEVVLPGFTLFLSLLLITALFALIFKVLPDAHIRWRDV